MKALGIFILLISLILTTIVHFIYVVMMAVEEGKTKPALGLLIYPIIGLLLVIFG